MAWIKMRDAKSAEAAASRAAEKKDSGEKVRKVLYESMKLHLVRL